MTHPWSSDSKHTDGDQPVWVHRNTGASRAERRAKAQRDKVRPAPARNKPYQKEDSK